MSSSNLFECKHCNYITTIRFNFNKHLESKKHYNKLNSIKKQFICNNCDTVFNNNVSLWRHKKKCVSDNQLNNEEKVTMLQLLKENSEVKQQLQTTNELLVELIKTTKNTNNINNVNNINNIDINNNSNNNNNNNTFSLNLFLNETCKDAMNIDDFLQSIEVTIPDLKRLGKYGYVEALSTMLISNLNNIDVNKRPMHCSDVKRETIYIREEDGWEKDNQQKEKINKVLIELTRLNTIALQSIYQEVYPDCLTNHKSKEHKEYGEIIYNAFGGSKGDTTKLNKHIIRNLVKEIKINK